MKIPYKWLKSYIDFDFSPEELAHELTMMGLEVEEVEFMGEELKNIVIGKITDIREHPQADKLVICNVDTGDEEIQIITGAPNVSEEIKVPVAKAGITLPGGNKVQETNLRGQLSCGMICSKDELGLMEERADGIMILNGDAEIGGRLIDYLGLDEYILKLDLTPNYARCLGILGIAREVKAIIEKDINYPDSDFETIKNDSIENYINIEIEAPDLCPRYTGRLLKNIKIDASPQWIQKRLEAAGVRPINNVVDITNYVMLEYNQPLHAFDYDKITGGEIIVRRAENGEKIITLDQEQLKLDDEVLVIADKDKPVALAGVMGGANSEVTEVTDNILLEAAYFDPPNIRKTAQKFGLKSEASHRFERGIDIENVVEASNRAAQLMQKYAGAEIVEGVEDAYEISFSPKKVEVEVNRVNTILGIEMEAATMKNILERLEFQVNSKKEGRKNSESFMVEVPSYRNDIEREADLIEEIARIHGYNNIPMTRAESRQAGRKTEEQKIRELIKNLMISCGLDEMNTFSLMDKDIYDKLGITRGHNLRDWVEIKNPLTEAFSILRTSLIPGIIDILSGNAKRQLDNLGFFEIGKVFWVDQEEDKPQEKLKLVCGSTGYPEEAWGEDAADFYYLKGVLDKLFTYFNLEQKKLSFQQSEITYFHPGRTASIIYDNEHLGEIGEILPEIRSRFDLDQRTAVFQLDLEKFIDEISLDTQRYIALPRFPAVSRDLALVMDKEIPTSEIIEAIEEYGGELLKQVNLFDLYKGTSISEGKKSLAFELTFQAEDRTLTDDEVNEIFQLIVKKCRDKFDVSIRK